MNKVLVVFLMMVLVFCMSTSAMAAPGAFISSPSGNPAPTVISFDPDDEDCFARLIITAYSQRDSLSEEKALIEKAYAEIVGSKDLTKLNSDFAELVKNKNIKKENLAVSDLFDISAIDCDIHDGHYGFEIVLSADTLKNFVALLHMNEDGSWELVEDAEVTHNGEHLKFSVNDFSPFAIVVDTAEYIAGDVNNDRIVNAKDVLILKRYIAGGWNIKDGEGFVLLLANIDYPKNDKINAEDGVTLKRFITDGWDVVLVVPESEALKIEGSVDSLKYGGLNNNSYESVQLSKSVSDAVATESTSGVTYFCIAVMVASAVALVLILVKNKKNV